MGRNSHPDEVIDPSEIIMETPRVSREKTSEVNPWMRFLARMTDYALFSLLLFFLIRFALPFQLLKKYDFMVPYPYLLWIPIEALFLFLWETTPGKFLLKTRVVHTGRGRWNYFSALRRSFLVWFRGMGLGIPVVSLITMLHAYSHLRLRKISSWDRDEKTKVIHQPLHPARLGVAIVIILASFILNRYFS